MGMTVKTVTRWLKGPILLFGIYLVLYGHITPGGGFGGGVVIASAFILIILASGERAGLSLFSKAAASRLDSVGLLIFLALGWLGTWWAGGYFFGNFISTAEDARAQIILQHALNLGMREMFFHGDVSRYYEPVTTLDADGLRDVLQRTLTPARRHITILTPAGR